MKRKCREEKLTRLILGAILLGAGTLGAPTAEATNYVINSYSLPSGMTDASGAYAIYPTNGEAGDTVTISYGTWTEAAGRRRCFYGGYGGYGSGGAVSYRTLIMNNGTIEDDLYGGFTYSGAANNNTVTVNGGTLYLASSLIYGGYAGGDLSGASNNRVDINVVGATVQGIRVGYGNTTDSTGNTLNLGATNIQVGDAGISYTQTIAITDGVSFSANDTVLSTAGSISGAPVLDLSGATALASSTTTSTQSMTLLNVTGSGQTNSITTVKDHDGTSKTLDSIGVTVKE